MDYQVLGKITNLDGKPANGIFVQVFESDQGTFEDRNDDLLGSTWIKTDGTFCVGFDESQFKDRFNILERGPDIFLKIRNEFGEVIHTTKLRKDIKKSQTKRLTFNVTLDPKSFENRIKPKEDPFSDVMNRRIRSFSSFGQRADFTDDLQRTFVLMLSSLNAWSRYNNEASWSKIGYDGPLVGRYPWRTKHKPHKVRWRKS